MKNRVLVVAPHPDDEILGCGGAILRHIKEGDDVAWLICTKPPEDMHWTKEFLQQRKKNIIDVAQKINFNEVFQLNFPATKLDTIPKGEIISEFSKIFEEYKPNQIYAPHRGDAHSDHKIVFDSVNACGKWFRYPYVKKILSYETPSETEFNYKDENLFSPNTYIDISIYLEEKLEIMSIYKSEISDFPFPRSIESIKALAKWRGSNVGYDAAEAFKLLFHRS